MFEDRFAFALPASVNFVGGGGKTSLILRLLHEYSATTPTIYTTTTRIHPPQPAEGMLVLMGDHADCLQNIVNRIGQKGDPRLRQLVVTQVGSRPDLAPGVSPDFAAKIDPELFPLLLNEADGARSMSLKMPREGEPVLMENSNYLVPVIGLDCLNRPLGPETLFRWEWAAERYSLEAGRLITPDLAASLLFHPQGVCRGWQPGMHVIPYINKVDSEDLDPLARRLAQSLLNNGRFPVDRVVWGSTHRLRTDAAGDRIH